MPDINLTYIGATNINLQITTQDTLQFTVAAGGGGTAGTTNHQSLTNREDEYTHPAASVSFAPTLANPEINIQAAVALLTPIYQSVTPPANPHNGMLWLDISDLTFAFLFGSGQPIAYGSGDIVRY